MKLKISISYDGNFINGWHGSRGTFIKNLLEISFFNAFHEKVEFFCSGRTDSGVHAIDQTCHFETKLTYSADKYKNGLNYKLPEFIKVIKSEVVDEDFHARFSAKFREYRYLVYQSQNTLPLLNKKALWVQKELDIISMKSVLEYLQGFHNFATFCPKKYTGLLERNLDKCELKIEKNCFYNIDVLSFTFIAKSFAYHQIRNLMGGILAVGKGNWTVDEFKNRMMKKDRIFGAELISASGLYFVKTYY